MIEYLEKLMRDKEYAQVADLAEHMLRHRDNSATDLLAIHWAILFARVALNDYSRAVVPGELTVQLAGDLRHWDRFGMACFDLGCAYYHLAQVDEAMDIWFRYLSHLSLYQDAAKFEANVRSNIAAAYTLQSNFTTASAEYAKAIQAAVRLGDRRLAHGIRQSLVGTLLKSGDLDEIPRLLVQCEHFLRNNPEAPDMDGNRLWQIKLRADYAMMTDRPRRARALSLRGIAESEGKPIQQLLLHMIVAKAAHRLAASREALAHAVAARVYANHFHLPELETEAAKLIDQISGGNPKAIDDLDEYYVADSTVLLSEDVPNNRGPN